MEMSCLKNRRKNSAIVRVKINIDRVSNLSAGKFHLFLLLALFSVPFVSQSQLPTSQQIAAKMTIGWNMGNTLEAICGETAWGGSVTTQKLIDSVKAAGFNTIRIPCAWFCHSDTITSEINGDQLARVKEVIDYCINDSIYVILNIHWDNGWLENRVNKANQDKVNERQGAYWTQIAEYFRDYDEHLLFAGSNEPNVDDANGMAVLMTYHQTFIDAVRSTGGNNSSKTLIIQGPSTEIDKTNQLMNTLPNDNIPDRLMVEVHYYTPYQFCLMSEDASWGKMFCYWGKNSHSKTDVSRNATWGEENDVEKYFGMMKKKFIDKGIPVIIGEFGAWKRKLSAPSDQDLNNKSVEYFYKYIVKSASEKGIITYCWDTNMGLFNRNKCTVQDSGVVNAIMEGYKESFTPASISFDNNNIELYPNPFVTSVNLQFSPSEKINRITLFDIRGNKTTTIDKLPASGSCTIGSSLKPGIYLIQVEGVNFIKYFKVLKPKD